uniref:Uncharacterized protein n=1 Tax=Knipowitschia caucasica TaxID=637954 RepID=A0AAV2LPM3_KNICA
MPRLSRAQRVIRVPTREPPRSRQDLNSPGESVFHLGWTYHSELGNRIQSPVPNPPTSARARPPLNGLFQYCCRGLGSGQWQPGDFEWEQMVCLVERREAALDGPAGER